MRRDLNGGEAHDNERTLSSLIRCVPSGSSHRVNRVNVNWNKAESLEGCGWTCTVWPSVLNLRSAGRFSRGEVPQQGRAVDGLRGGAPPGPSPARLREGPVGRQPKASAPLATERNTLRKELIH